MTQEMSGPPSVLYGKPNKLSDYVNCYKVEVVADVLHFLLVFVTAASCRNTR